MPGLVLALLFIPVAEIYVIVRVGQAIGAGPTILLLIAEAVLGARLIKREGRRAWVALVESLGAGRMPTRELIDSALVLVGGAFLIAPGFLTDIVGFFLVLPLTRPLARRTLISVVTRRLNVTLLGPLGRQPGPGGATGPQRPKGPRTDGASRGPRSDDRVVEGEIVDDDGSTPGRPDGSSR